MITTPCEVCGQPIENVGDGLGTCTNCQTTTPITAADTGIMAAYTDQKATIIIKQYLQEHTGQPTNTEDISKQTGIPSSQTNKILDKLSR